MSMPDFDTFCRTLVQDAPDAIIFADEEGLIRFWNKGAERMFGFDQSEAVGQSLDLIIPHGLRARHWEGYRNVMATGRTRYGSGDVLAVPALRRGKERISVEFTIIPFRADDGRVQGIAAIMRDVTKRFEEMKALKQRLSSRESG